MLSKISQLTVTFFFLSHSPLKRIVHVWFTSFYLMQIKKFINLVEVMKVTLECQTYL